MGKAKGADADELVGGYTGIERALRSKDVKAAIRAGRIASVRARELGDFRTYHDLRLTTNALDAGYWNGKSYVIDSVDRKRFLRDQGDVRSPNAYIEDNMELEEGAFGGSDILFGARKYVRSAVSAVFIVVGGFGLRASVTGNAVGSSVDGLPLSVLFLVLGLLGMYLQVRKRGFGNSVSG